MSTDDWQIHPRNADLTRTLDPVSGWSKLHLIERYNTPDTWTLNGPSYALGGFAPGMGCIVDRNGEQVTSGQVTRIRRVGSIVEGRVIETITLSFESDLAALGGRVVRPAPGTYFAPGVISRFPADYDLRSGNVEDLILGYISSNIGPAARASRRLPRLRLPLSQKRGGDTQVSGRLDNLGVLVQQLADFGGLRVRIVHAEDADGSWLDLKIEG